MQRAEGGAPKPGAARSCCVSRRKTRSSKGISTRTAETLTGQDRGLGKPAYRRIELDTKGGVAANGPTELPAETVGHLQLFV
jgi:hypothetical protein